MYENILVPTDGSKGAKRGAEHAIDLAKRYDATVHVLYVLDERIHGGTPALSSDEVFFEKLEDDGRDVLAKISSEVEYAGLDATTSCVRGVPYEKILEYADENDVDLIAMGTSGRSGLDRYLLGSTTAKTVRRSEIPVLSVPEPASE